MRSTRKMRSTAILGIMVVLALAVCGARVQAAPVLSGMELWLKADAGLTMGGDYVEHWADQSGNGHVFTSRVHLVGWPPEWSPVYEADGINGLPSVNLQDYHSYMFSDAGFTMDSWTAFVVARVDGNGDTTIPTGYVLGWAYSGLGLYRPTGDTAAGYEVNTSSPALGVPGTFEGQIKTTSPGLESVRFNGETAATYPGAGWATWGMPNTQMALGARIYDGYGMITGLISEVLIYDRILTEGERNFVGYFLQTKYGLIGDYTAPVAGDADLDGKVDGSDLAIMATNWLGAGNWLLADFTGDTVINGSDLAIMATNWNFGVSGGSPVPEPTTLILLGIGAVTLIRRRRAA